MGENAVITGDVMRTLGPVPGNHSTLLRSVYARVSFPCSSAARNPLEITGAASSPYLASIELAELRRSGSFSVASRRTKKMAP